MYYKSKMSFPKREIDKKQSNICASKKSKSQLENPKNANELKNDLKSLGYLIF